MDRLLKMQLVHALSAIGRKVCLAGGSSHAAQLVARVQIVDPAALTCSLGTALPTPAFECRRAGLGNGKWRSRGALFS